MREVGSGARRPSDMRKSLRPYRRCCLYKITQWAALIVVAEEARESTPRRQKPRKTASANVGSAPPLPKLGSRSAVNLAPSAASRRTRATNVMQGVIQSQVRVGGNDEERFTKCA